MIWAARFTPSSAVLVCFVNTSFGHTIRLQMISCFYPGDTHSVTLRRPDTWDRNPAQGRHYTHSVVLLLPSLSEVSLSENYIVVLFRS